MQGFEGRSPPAHQSSPFEQRRIAEPRHVQAVLPSYNGVRGVERSRKSWRGLEAVVDQVRSDDSIDATLTSDTLQVSAVLEEVGGRFEVTGSVPRAAAPARGTSGNLSLLPAGFAARAAGRPLAFVRHMTLRIDAGGIDEGAPAAASDPRLMFGEPKLSSLCRLIADECADDHGGGLYGECLVTAFLIGLGRLSESTAWAASRNAMAPWQMRRTREYFASHLAKGVTLQDLADLTRMSRSYFCRAFKATTGVSPYQFFLDARVDEAKRLLLGGRHSIADISFAVGFTDQSHFSRTFRRTVGASPRAWQRSRGGEERAPRLAQGAAPHDRAKDAAASARASATGRERLG